MTPSGPLTIAADVLGDLDIILTAGDRATAGQNITVNGSVTVRSDNQDVLLQSGDDATLAAGSMVSAAAGQVQVLGDFGNADPTAGSLISLLGRLVSGSQALVQGNTEGDIIILNPDAANRGSNTTTLLLDGRGGNDAYEIQLGNLSGAVQIATPANPPADPDAGTDTATITGTTAADDLTLANLAPNGSPQTGGSVVLTSPSQTIEYTQALEFLTVLGQTGDDTFHVQPSQTAEILVHGNAPSFGPGFVPPGDTLDFDPLGNWFNLCCGQILTEGGSPADFKAVNFRSIENLPLSPLGSSASTLRFDLDASPTSSTQTDYTRVLPDVPWGMGGATYGWTVPLVSSGSTQEGGFERSNLAAPSGGTDYRDLRQDGHFSHYERTFRVDLPAGPADGWYLVSVTFGDADHARDEMQVTDANTGRPLLEHVATAAGQFSQRWFVVQAQSRRLDLTFSDANSLSGDPYWSVNAIEIRPGQVFDFGLAEPGSLTADGVTVDTFTGYLAPAE